MKVVEASEAQERLRDLLAEVEDGATITISKDGAAVALLVPPTGDGRRDVGDVIDDIREFRRRERLSLGDVSIRELVEEGRRW